MPVSRIWSPSQALLNCGLNVSTVSSKDFCSEVLFKAVLLFTFSLERNRNVSQLIRPAPVDLSFRGWGIGKETSGYTADTTSSPKGEEQRYSIEKDFSLWRVEAEVTVQLCC